MEKHIYVIVFSDGEKIKQLAWCYEEARILAQAKRIDEDKEYWTITDWYIKKDNLKERNNESISKS